MHLAGSVWGGTAQANGNSTRLVTRGGVEARLDYSRLVITGHFKLNDFGPFDYHRDFNLTFRVQAMLDIAWTAKAPRWFVPLQTKFGVAGKYRVLDVNSPRYDLTQAIVGTEWEVKTYVGARAADYKVPKKILFMDEIPKGATGKLQRIGLAQKLGLG